MLLSCPTHARGLDVRSRRTYSRLSSAAVLQSATPCVQQARLQQWHDVDAPLIWKGDEAAASAQDSPANSLPPPWKILLFSDGSVTRHLQLLTGNPSIHVNCMSMDILTQEQLDAVPAQAQQIAKPLLQRQVLLCCESAPHVPLVYATSWWASDTVDKYLADKDLPIWVSLTKGRLELYREIQTVALGSNPELEQLFGCAGPFWSRQYLFWHQGAPLTLIHEVFSNKLQTYLGPTDGPNLV